MDESAKLELEQQARLYQFYVDCYLKGVAFFLAITAALLKFALDSSEHRAAFALAGALCSLAIATPLGFAFVHERRLAADFQRLAENTSTSAIDTGPMRMLIYVTAAFWAIIVAGWAYILLRL